MCTRKARDTSPRDTHMLNINWMQTHFALEVIAAAVILVPSLALLLLVGFVQFRDSLQLRSLRKKAAAIARAQQVEEQYS
jgi:hypothetical protein